MVALLIALLHRIRTWLNLNWYRLRSRLSLRMNARLGPPPHLPSLPQLTKITAGCIRVLGENPGSFTLQGTNTYLVGSSEDKILVDSSDGNGGYLRLLRRALGTEHSVKDIILTHEHPDHMGGIFDIRKWFPNARVWKFMPPSDTGKISNDRAREWGIKSLRNGQRFRLDKSHATNNYLEVVHTPGHTDDHICLHWPRERLLFSGDCILGNGSSTVIRGLEPYMRSLRLMQSLDITRICPGHGDVIEEAHDRIGKALAHRERREQQVINALEEHGEPMTSSEITDKVYAAEGLSGILLMGARGNVEKHLEKLRVEERVYHTSGGWFMRKQSVRWQLSCK